MQHHANLSVVMHPNYLPDPFGSDGGVICKITLRSAMKTAYGHRTLYSISILSQQNMAQYSAQILKTLADQIQHLSPLRDSFRHLQAYYAKLTAEFNDLLQFGDRSELEMLSKLKYLEEVHRQLEQEFCACGEELRQAECEQAKLLMERNQQAAQSQALQARLELENGQKSAFQSKRKELLEHGSRVQFNIGKYRELIHNLSLAIKSKEYENLDIEREIKKMELVNSKIIQLNKETELKIDQTHQSNEQVIEELHSLEEKLESYNKLIAHKEKLNKDSQQAVITKTEELEQLRHRRQYIGKMIENEDAAQRELMRSYGEVDSILTVRREKLQLLQQENHQYESAISEEQLQKAKNKEELEKLSHYLQTLVQTNEILFRELERSCTEDREVQVMLSEKLEKLMLANDKITETEMLSRFDLNAVHQNRLVKGGHSSTTHTLKKEHKEQKEQRQYQTFKFNSSGTPMAKKHIQSLQDRISRSREQMASTWGSFSKQNYRFD